ncbi:MAG: 50S ribosomal protein L24 [Candidatus Bipolaricaulota bacterium]|nr:50S ribosomal protein L24 [Candidatus Bipolaricaulota bacterium]
MEKVRKGDRIKVISGNDRGKTGKVMVVYPERERIIVENVHMITKHQRATQNLREPGIIKREGTIHISNVLPICPECGVPTRVGFAVVDGEKMRRCKQCGEIFR